MNQPTSEHSEAVMGWISDICASVETERPTKQFKQNAAAAEDIGLDVW